MNIITMGAYTSISEYSFLAEFNGWGGLRRFLCTTSHEFGGQNVPSIQSLFLRNSWHLDGCRHVRPSADPTGRWGSDLKDLLEKLTVQMDVRICIRSRK